jgi:hypothetical protein
MAILLRFRIIIRVRARARLRAWVMVTLKRFINKDWNDASERGLTARVRVRVRV